MCAKQVQWRRGSTDANATFVGANGEITIDTDKKTVVVHDGVKPGGFPLATESNLNLIIDEIANIDSGVISVAGKQGIVTLTKSDVGLSNVDNTSDASKNVLGATKLTTARTIALSGDVVGSASFDGTANLSVSTTIQPNSISTAAIAPVGTSGIYTKVSTNDKGQVVSGESLTANDIPNLDASKITSGIIDAARLPASGGSISEYASLSQFPVTGDSGKVYIALDTNKMYRWSGSAYVSMAGGAVDSVAGKTGVVTLAKADVGLNNVDNTSDINKPISTDTQTALNTKVDTTTNQTIAGTKTFSSTIIGSITGNAATATKLETARTINGVVFDGSANITITAAANGGTSAACSGNSGTATKLATARTINGVAFDGTANITVSDDTKAPLTGTGASGTWGINITGSAETAKNVSGGRVQVQGIGNDYNLGGIEVLGNGVANTVFPSVGFNQGGLYASSLQLRGGGDFRFYNQGEGSYANVTANTFIGNLSGNAVTATNAGYATNAGRAHPKRSDGADLNFFWSGQGGQPPWLWGGSDGANMYVYNPSNFNVNYANSAGYAGTVAAATSTVSGGIKARLDGTTLYITTNGNNA